MSKQETQSRGCVLVVDDERAMCELVETTLTMKGFEVSWCQNAADALERIQQVDIDAVLTDVKMPGTSGIELCEQIHKIRRQLPVVVMTAFGSLETAVSALRAGAYDFVTKPFEIDLLVATLSRAVDYGRLQSQVRLLTDQIAKAESFGELIGQSKPMRALYEQLGRVADSESSILITGESGTGKEVVARSIHQQSKRASKPFVAVNCAALSESLLESELFGHSKGAFTDARNERAGLFAEANGGTLLLDEMGDMPMALQVKLLRALEEGKIRPVGSDKEVEVDVRVLTATHRDLESAVEEGRFREDLFYRINVIQLHLPPLRARGNDILLIANHFVTIFAKRSGKSVNGLSESAAEKLLSYSWPGNIRQLRNVIERAVALTRFDQISVEDLPEKIRDHRQTSVFIGGDDPTELVTIEELERRYIDHVLGCVQGNKTLAAQILGVDRKTLYRKLKRD
ncbi:Transcriptional regulatory protein ZraR [Rubripirellula amarantea]|uniref:Transcriptional regulatory protein ZraR n=1 Tax=Rubripirellula amarantea TaxID=2527999 RepID=A0A5C5WKP1_9BACT|nr:sigma-54 dependent transcriptional regulator [Rubripirellula amarantea]TWT51187.1 Transcriptional regulatory protein ZraR [Rubripirellula amarantea]